MERFKNYLIDRGYSQFTPSGNKSTVYDYIGRINRICKRENITVSYLNIYIDRYVDKYDIFGDEEEFGAKSHRAYINALKAYRDFLNTYLE